jgi:arginyl-tRNA synthetase
MFIETREEVEEALSTALSALDLPTDDLGIEEPPADVDAVLASSVGYRLADDAGAAPPEVAAELVDAIDVEALTYVGSVEAEGAYCNFLPSESYFEATLEAGQSREYGQLPARDESVVVEHTSANPTGPIHVGRARNPIVGDAIANALEYAGYDVDRHYYVNDAGRQMAVFTWAYETFDGDELPEPERDRIEYELVRYYRKGNEVLEEGDPDEVEKAEEEIQSILQGMEAGDEETFERVGEVVDQVLSGMQECLERLPAEFDEFVKETRFLRDGSCDEVLEELRESEYAEADDGAWQLDLSEWGIDKEFVFLRSDGTTLYTTRDLAHHEWKFDTYDRAVTVLGEDQELHARQLEAALELLGNDVDRLDSVHYSWVNLPEGSMSTRQGTGVDLDDLLDESIHRARREVEQRLEDRVRDDDLTEADVERIAHQVGIGAVRFDIVAKQLSKTITFEWDRALDFEAQSAPYVQYVHARCCGILDSAADASGSVDAGALETEAAEDLLRTTARFPAVVETAAEDYEPHTVATYARELADDFNTFYRECPVLDATGSLREARIAVVLATQHTVANTLDVLGIDAPESM